MVTQTELKRYYKAIGQALHCPPSARNSILKTAKSDIEEYLTENPDASMDELQKNFGTPEAYAREYAANSDLSKLSSKLSRRKILNKVWIGLTAAIVVIALIFAFLKENRDLFTPSYISVNEARVPLRINNSEELVLANEYVEHNIGDSTYVEIEVYEVPVDTEAQSYCKTGYKLHTIRDAEGDIKFQLLLSASFWVTKGSPTEYVSSTIEYKSLDSDWIAVIGDSSGRDNRAVGSVRFQRKHLFAEDENESHQIELHCDMHGNFW